MLNCDGWGATGRLRECTDPLCVVDRFDPFFVAALSFATLVSSVNGSSASHAVEPPAFSNSNPADASDVMSTREQRAAAIAAIPVTRLTPAARDRISGIVQRPTFYRHLPTQTIDCDPDLFICVTRQPEFACRHLGSDGYHSCANSTTR